jgi:tetratricopeptide (TPR) repeat protein
LIRSPPPGCFDREFRLNRQPLLRFALLAGLVLAAPAGRALSPAVPAPPQAIAMPQLVVPRPADGASLQPVRLDAVRIDTEIQGSQALTRVELSFVNPNPRPLEGELQFPLLDGQAVTGLALDFNGSLREAVPVDKARGQQVFEDVARVRVDPALLEQTRGNNYKLRIYPLMPDTPRRVVLRYAETLAARDGVLQYRLPLAYAEMLDSLDLSVRVFGADTAPVASGLAGLDFARRGAVYEARVARSRYAGHGVLEVRLPAPRLAAVSIQERGDKLYFQAEVPAPALAPRPRRLPHDIGLVWDASGSGAARDHARELALLDRYFGAMDSGRVRLVLLRDAATAAQEFRIEHGDWSALRRALEAVDYDGATALAALPELHGAGEVLLFSDGLSNFGAPELPRASAPVYAVCAALSADPAALRELARRSGGRAIDAGGSLEAAAAALLEQPAVLEEAGGEGLSGIQLAGPYPGANGWTVAGIMDPEAGGRLLHLRLRLPGGGARSIDVPLGTAERGAFAAATWARLRIDSLAGEYALNRAAIRRLGEDFGLATRETSLLVLDRVQDYVRYGIAPPAELRAEYEHLLAVRDSGRAGVEQEHLERVVQMFRDKQAWWSRDFPRTPPPPAKPVPPPLALREEEMRREAQQGYAPAAAMAMPAPAPPPAAAADMAAPARAAAQYMTAGTGMGRAKAADAATETPEEATIRLKGWSADAPYQARLHQAGDADLYRVYLDERPGWTDSSAFFLDAADEFLARGQRALGLRVLSNLAEMNLENRALLRILGYRLLQAGEPGLALPVFQQVLALAPNEPQSWRDLGLAYEADGQMQKALDHLWQVAAQAWDGRFPEIELIALAELNEIAARHPEVDTSRIDPRLLRNLPLDLRVILTWDADNTDIDLWVTDPNGEKAYYGNPLSRQGGRMSRDFTQGYGPEEFSLKTALPGTYKVEANFYGNHQQVVAGATTLQLKLFTGYGTPRQQEKAVTLRLKSAGEVVYVGEFEVGGR